MRSTAVRVFTAATATLGLMAVGTAASAAETFEVERGDTLSDIAREIDGIDHWRELHAANPDIADPDLIFPGQVLQVSADAAGEVEVTEATAPAEPSEPTTEPAATTGTGVWDRLAQCESGGDWSINTGNGYYGGLQFSLGSWEAVGGAGYPHEASRDAQIVRAERLLDRQGWGAWPACSAKLGLR